MAVDRMSKENEKKKLKRVDTKKLVKHQLRDGDTVIVLCEKCKWISFDHKFCMHCHVPFPATTEAKIIRRNKQITKVASRSVKPPKLNIRIKEEAIDQPREDKNQQELIRRHQQPKAVGNKSQKELVLRHQQLKAKEYKNQQESVLRHQLPKTEEVKNQESVLRRRLLKSKKYKNQLESVLRHQLIKAKEDKNQQESVLRHQLPKAKKDKNQQESVLRHQQPTAEEDKNQEKSVLKHQQPKSKEDKNQQESIIKHQQPKVTEDKNQQESVLKHQQPKAKEDKNQQESVSKYQQPKAKSKTNKDYFQSILKSVQKIDLDSLNEKTFLNDTIIDVYLQYIYHKQFDEDIRERSHIFSTHFFSTLKKEWKNAENKKEIDVESKIDWVSSNMWTKKMDLFSKDFLFIPIHNMELRHWYLMVVCYLPEFIKGPPTPKKKQSSEPPNTEPNEKMPCIYYFDSLDKKKEFNDDKTMSAKYLTEFLEMLWKNKNPAVNYKWDQLHICKTNCPQQNNLYDCGIYVLHYVENFFKIPIAPLFDFSKWFPTEEVKNKRTEVRNTITKLQEKESVASHYSSDSDVN